MPKLLPARGRGPYEVAIATEHIRTPVAENGAFNGAEEKEGFGPLELIAQVRNVFGQVWVLSVFGDCTALCNRWTCP